MTVVQVVAGNQCFAPRMQSRPLIDGHQRDAGPREPILRTSLNVSTPGLRGTTMAVMGVTKFERFFRAAAELDVDKQDLKRYHDFVNRKIHDLLLRAEATAKANGRDIVDPQDLPITKGLQECMHAFKKLDGEIQVDPILEQITPRPPLDLAMRDMTEAKLPEVAGGLSVALARAFKIIDPKVKDPATEEWERAFQIFNLLL
jgi:hypothetical protein